MRGMPDARDYAYLWAWEPIHPEEIAVLLSGFARPLIEWRLYAVAELPA